MRRTFSSCLIFLLALSLSAVPPATAGKAGPAGEKKVTKTASEIHVYIKEGGKRYHKKNCPAVPTGKTRVTLREAVDRGYTPCKVCDPPVLEEIRVWVNPRGEKYHRKDCRMVQDDAVEMSLSEAIEKGHTPCKICAPPQEDSSEKGEEEEEN